MFEGEHKYTKIGLAMGVTIGVDAAKSGNNTHFLVVMRVRLSHKIGCARLLEGAFNAIYVVYILLAHKCRPPRVVLAQDKSLTS